METWTFLLVLVPLLLFVERSECDRCFGSFDLTTGECSDELGEVSQDDCCQNSRYGYEAEDGSCNSCGPPTWSPWSSWSYCNVLCGEGVKQRRRKCHGIGECEGPDEKLETDVCSGTCCDDKGWGSWNPWSPCSVTCEGQGTRFRRRTCSSPPECRAACSGPEEEQEPCEASNKCPVHGSWSSWTAWSQCSGSCISDTNVPSRERQRACSSPAPSTDTVPPGDQCPGDAFERQDCSELPNCPVDGNWGPWSAFTPCPATCGVALQVSERRCNNPPPSHGGRPCLGDGKQTKLCSTQVHCPVNGVWAEWSTWTDCTYAWGGKEIRCQKIGGKQTRMRSCLHRAHNGSICMEGKLTDTQVCYNVERCYVKGSWEGWEPWSLCRPACGDGSKRRRSRICTPDYSEYSPTIGRQREPANFYGRPTADCGPAPEGGKRQVQDCLNVPPCT
ncbi:properdin-like isoform 2-T2 [Fundulus diaphanus]